MNDIEINESLPDSATAESRVISSFWKRVGALAIDWLLMSLIGFLLGACFFDFLADLGSMGKLLGFVISLLYFGVLNSSIGNGQTVGKRLMKIAVVDRSGRPISLIRSLLRYTVFAAPYFLNNTSPPPSLGITPVFMVYSLIILGGGLSIVYLYVFNRKTRQSLHDLVTGTFVVQNNPEGNVPDRIWQPHLIVAAVLLAAAFFAPLYVQRIVGELPEFSELTAVQEELIDSGMVTSANLAFGKSWTMKDGDRTEKTYLQAAVSVRAPAKADEATCLKIAEILFDHYESILEKDQIAIVIIRGYDIGIARASYSFSQSCSPAEWLEKMEETDQ